MKIKMLAISKENIKTYPKILSVLLNSLVNLSEIPLVIPETYQDVQTALPKIAETIEDCDVLFLLTTCETYLKAKDDIAKAFHFTMQVNEKTDAKLRKNSDYEILKAHAMLPATSMVFSLSDGLYSSFVIRSKTQSIIFMPICEDRTFITMKQCVFPFLDKYHGCNCTNFYYYETDYASVVLRNAIGDSDVNIAVANTSVFKYIQKNGIANVAINTYTTPIPYIHENDINDYDEYALMKAIAAAEYLKTSFGGAIISEESEIEGDYCVHIAVVNDRQSIVKTVSSVPDESYSDFIQTVVTEFLLISAKIVSAAEILNKETGYNGLSNEENKVYEGIEDLPVTPAVKGWKILLYLVLIAGTCGLAYYAIQLLENGTFFFGL